MVTTLGYHALRFVFSRVRACPGCGKRSLVFVEGLRPVIGRPEAADLIRSYHACRSCERRYLRTARGEYREIEDTDEWERVLETMRFYRNARST